MDANHTRGSWETGKSFRDFEFLVFDPVVIFFNLKPRTALS